MTMDDFLEGRENVVAYTTFFDKFLPCATKKTLWETQIERVASDLDATKVPSICTVSDEAFALLLLENSFDRWVDLHIRHKGASGQRRGLQGRGLKSDVPPLYTRGGIKFEQAEMQKMEKGWSAEGRLRFNVLWDQVVQDRADNPSFERDWLKARRLSQENTRSPKKKKRDTVVTRCELFDNVDDDGEGQALGNKSREDAADSESEDETYR